ncbi:hypothetical protein L6164_005344 [Bauhinia variegata]|uniref:Uncharacterized protein n=1 Tax=Bauhinia variegata TaxID=167791 RepID=A0ACB9PT49_BAUVA|nr:hypothetical protein L6164_005344 [Bauhinia variegata]
MDIHFPVFLSIFTISSFLLKSLPLSRGLEDVNYRACNATYSCGDLRNITYPFWGQNRPQFCDSSDMFKLNCDQFNGTSIQVGSQTYQVTSIDESNHTMRLNVQRDFADDFCPTNFTITSLNPPVFHYPTQTVENWTVFYKCPPDISNSLPAGFNNSFRCTRENGMGFTNQAFRVNETQLQSQKYNSLLACAIKVPLPV